MGGQKTGKDFDMSASKKAAEQSNELPDEWKMVTQLQGVVLLMVQKSGDHQLS